MGIPSCVCDKSNFWAIYWYQWSDVIRYVWIECPIMSLSYHELLNISPGCDMSPCYWWCFDFYISLIAEKQLLLVMGKGPKPIANRGAQTHWAVLACHPGRFGSPEFHPLAARRFPGARTLRSKPIPMKYMTLKYVVYSSRYSCQL